MASYGFHLAETGGGCTAYARLEVDGGYTLITKIDDVEAPTRLSQRCAVGYYSEAGEPSFTFALLSQALSSLGLVR